MLPTFAPNLAWRNEPLRAAVEQRTGLPVVVENDADAAAWGETRFGAGNGHPAITGPMVTMGAVAGDPVALESFKAVGAWLGHGMAAQAAILDPRVFIVGGGVSEAGELLIAPARDTFQSTLTARGHRPTAPSGSPSWARTPA